MHSGGLTYEETLPAYAEGLSAYGEALPVADAAEDVPERFDRGQDWSLAFAIFTPVAAADGAIAYGLYLAADAIF